MKVLQLGKFYPPAKGGMETILALICEKTTGARRRIACLSPMHTRTTVEERHGMVEVCARRGAWRADRRGGRLSDNALRARARGSRPHRAPRAEPDGLCCRTSSRDPQAG